jgi:hypothetical protein
MSAPEKSTYFLIPDSCGSVVRSKNVLQNVLHMIAYQTYKIEAIVPTIGPTAWGASENTSQNIHIANTVSAHLSHQH